MIKKLYLSQLAHKTVNARALVHRGGRKTAESKAHSTSRSSQYRPFMPTFMQEDEHAKVELVEHNEDSEILAKYQALGPDFQSAISFKNCLEVTKHTRPRQNQNNQGKRNYGLQKKLGSLSIPNLDGSTRCVARACNQKLDTYFALNQMKESDVIKFATLHLEGAAHKWRYHGLVTQGLMLS